MRALLTALRIVPEHQPAEPENTGLLIECPDGLVVGATIDDNGREIGGEFVPCERQVAYKGACPRCGGRSWVPAAPPASSPETLRERRELREQRDIMKLVGRMD